MFCPPLPLRHLPAIILRPGAAGQPSLLDLTGLPLGDYQVSVLDGARRVLLSAQLPAGRRHALTLTDAAAPYALLVRGTARDGTRLHVALRFT